MRQAVKRGEGQAAGGFLFSLDWESLGSPCTLLHQPVCGPCLFVELTLPRLSLSYYSLLWCASLGLAPRCPVVLG